MTSLKRITALGVGFAARIPPRSKTLFRTGFVLVTGATVLVAVAPITRADQNSDFLGCLSNHGITWDDKDAMIKLFHNTQQIISSEMYVFYLTHQGLDQATAQKVAQCVQASPGSKTAQANRGSQCSTLPDMDCRPNPSGYLDQVRTAGITANSGQTLLTIGQQICTDLRRGTPTVSAASGLRQTNPSITLHQGNVAVDAALMNLCPELMRVDADQEPIFLPLE